MTVITLTTGLPASGKSTWAKELEQDALAVQDAAILAAVAQGKDVIVDNTHLNSRTPNRIKKLFDGEITFKVKDFTNVWATECVRRDAERENSVGSEVIYRMAKQLQKPWRLTEAYMNDYIPLEPYKPDPSTAMAIVVDIDGTLARHDHRSPYDYSKVLTDGVHEHIRDIVTKYYEDDYFVLVVSGRPDSCEQDTYKWLYHNRIPFDDVFMRKTGDQRNDADIKHEIFNRHIRNQYDVRIWLDDRDRVVRRMRKLGINVLQVAEGKF
jgi:predicted kinase